MRWVFAFLLICLAAAPLGPAVAEEGAGTAAAPSEADPPPPSAGDLVLLRQIGFNEAQILAELAPFEGRLPYDAAALATLSEAGFSAGFLDRVKALAPRPRLDNAAVAAALDAGVGTLALIERIAAADTAFDTSAPAMLALRRGRDVPVAATKAMLGAPLTAEDLRLLADGGTAEAVQLRLLEMLGSEVALDDPAAALSLSRAGVPAGVLAALRERPAAAAGEPRTGADTAPADALPAELSRFTHVTDIFTVAYPRGWYVTRRAALEGPVYQASAYQPAADAPARLTAEGAGVIVQYWPREAISASDSTDAVDLLDDTLSRAFAQQLGEVEATGPGTTVTLAGHETGRREYTSTVGGQPVRLLWHLAITEGHYVGVMMHAPADSFDGRARLFDVLAGELAFPRSAAARETTGSGFTSRELARRYGEAVVFVAAADEYGEWTSTGSGFFTRADGYILTNRHVIWNREANRPWRFFRIYWSHELDKEPLDAQLIAEVGERSELSGPLNVGTDLAMLKVSGIGDFDTIPLSPLARTSIGDPLITMGFPIKQVFDARNATTISSGVVTRFTRDGEGRVDTIITDAKVAPGNSGGPAISLSTGGVIGLNTRTAPQAFARAENRNVRESIGYAGIMPIDRAIENFPQQTIVRAERDRTLSATDAYDLALFAEQQGWRAGAISLAEKAVQRAPNVASTHHCWPGCCWRRTPTAAGRTCCAASASSTSRSRSIPVTRPRSTPRPTTRSSGRSISTQSRRSTSPSTRATPGPGGSSARASST